MVADRPDWKHLDRPTGQLLQKLRAAIFAAAPMADELPHIPTVGNAMSQRGLKGAIDDAFNCMHLDHADSDD
jgi:hypothetical protein